MPILTLTTDWGLRDHYLASFKGELLTLIPSLTMIDVSHDVEKFNTMQAAYIVQNVFHKFPAGSMHFIGVACNENCNIKNPYVLINTIGQYLIGEDNGIFTMILGKKEKEIIRLPMSLQSDRIEINKIILSTIKSIADGSDFRNLGSSENTIVESYFAQPTLDLNTIRGTIIYLDTFGNAVVNITKELFFETRRDRNFIIYLRKSIYDVTEISLTYEDVEVGEMLALFNQDGFLEISLNKESAGKLLGLKLMDTIRIEFDDSQAG